MSTCRLNARVFGATVVIAVLCGGAANAGEDEVSSISLPLTGQSTMVGCTTRQRAFFENTLAAARFVAVSRGFGECVDTTTRHGATLTEQGGNLQAGPYAAHPRDPFSRATMDERVSSILRAVRSTTDVTIRCSEGNDAEAGVRAWAHIGNYDARRQAPEVLTVYDPVRALANQDTGSLNTVADLFQQPRAWAARTIWHEAMHQWGYTHDLRGAPTPEQVAAGMRRDTQYNRRVPAFVGYCMETVMAASRTCSITCAQGQRPVRRFSSNTCDCVDDPEQDVGVILGAGEACPTPSGRHSAEVTELYMDDEDTRNRSRSEGWIGQLSSGDNTWLRFCRVPGAGFRRRLAPTPEAARNATYAVSRMSAACPRGSVALSRYFDNEDFRNRNRTIGYVAPHGSSGSGTRLELCMFRGTTRADSGTNGPFPNLNVQYGVFAGALPGALARGLIRTDDEDSRNRNRLTGNTQGADTFLSGGSNTQLRVARVR